MGAMAALLAFCSAFMLILVVLPVIIEKVLRINERRTRNLTNQMDRMFLRAKVRTVFLVFTFGPTILAMLGYLLFPAPLKLAGIIFGIILGFSGPSIYIRVLDSRRKSQFQDQLIDVLMIMSSSLKGGLSLIQAMEVLVEEMSPPACDEFGIILGENKMGVSLEDSLKHLFYRMPSSALDQMITSILLARETGGNLPVIFQRIITTIRENKKIQQNLDNLTLQGKIQGVIMSLLPIAFSLIVTSTNPQFFDRLLHTDIGRVILIYAVVSEVIGMLLIWRISTFREF